MRLKHGELPASSTQRSQARDSLHLFYITEITASCIRMFQDRAILYDHQECEIPSKRGMQTHAFRKKYSDRAFLEWSRTSEGSLSSGIARVIAHVISMQCKIDVTFMGDTFNAFNRHKSTSVACPIWYELGSVRNTASTLAIRGVGKRRTSGGVEFTGWRINE